MKFSTQNKSPYISSWPLLPPVNMVEGNIQCQKFMHNHHSVGRLYRHSSDKQYMSSSSSSHFTLSSAPAHCYTAWPYVSLMWKICRVGLCSETVYAMIPILLTLFFYCSAIPIHLVTSLMLLVLYNHGCWVNNNNGSKHVPTLPKSG